VYVLSSATNYIGVMWRLHRRCSTICEATTQMIMRKPNWTEKQVREALAHAGGIPAEAARYLAQTYGRTCARNTISTYLARSEALRAF
jgi:hypothetical protein